MYLSACTYAFTSKEKKIGTASCCCAVSSLIREFNFLQTMPTVGITENCHTTCSLQTRQLCSCPPWTARVARRLKTFVICLAFSKKHFTNVNCLFSLINVIFNAIHKDLWNSFLQSSNILVFSILMHSISHIKLNIYHSIPIYKTQINWEHFITYDIAAKAPVLSY